MTRLLLPKPPKREIKPPKRLRRSGMYRRKPSMGPRVRATGALGEYRKSVKEADKLFSLYVRVRDGHRCRICQSDQATQCAHLFSRRYKAVRWNPDNAWTLCAHHHLYYTHNPLEWEDLLRSKMGEEGYWSLRMKALSRGRAYMPELILSLRLLLKSVSESAPGAKGAA